MVVFQKIIGLSDMSILGSILSAFTLLTVCKVSTDMIIADPDLFWEGVKMIVIGSLLASTLLFVA